MLQRTGGEEGKDKTPDKRQKRWNSWKVYRWEHMTVFLKKLTNIGAPVAIW